MTEPAEELGAEDLRTEAPEDLVADLEDGRTGDPDWEISPGDVMRRLAEAENAVRDDFGQLAEQVRQDFERLAAAVAPLLTKQYSETQQRMRVLEMRLRNRQERPLILVLANLLTDVRRLESAKDVKEHVEDTIAEALTRAGYQETGAPGDQFDPSWHEPVSGSAGRRGVVSHVYSRGLACHGDVITKAKVDVEPAVGAHGQGGYPE
jgi:molecular chaperone GrpE (heat shock protein)